MYTFEESQNDFYVAVLEAVAFTLEDDGEFSVSLDNELFIHANSFLLRALVWLNAENDRRAQNNQGLKTISDLAHDFVFTALGHGVGFWEESESDWLYYNDTLEGLADKYFYKGYSVYLGEDGLVYGG